MLLWKPQYALVTMSRLLLTSLIMFDYTGALIFAQQQLLQRAQITISYRVRRACWGRKRPNPVPCRRCHLHIIRMKQMSLISQCTVRRKLMGKYNYASLHYLFNNGINYILKQQPYRIFRIMKLPQIYFYKLVNR